MPWPLLSISTSVLEWLLPWMMIILTSYLNPFSVMVCKWSWKLLWPQPHPYIHMHIRKGGQNSRNTLEYSSVWYNTTASNWTVEWTELLFVCSCLLAFTLSLPQLDNLLCSFSPELVQLVEEVLPALKDNMTVWVVDHTSPSEDFSSLLDKLEHVSGEPLSDPPKVDIMSNFLFIFTSGTTGTARSLYSLVITLPTAGQPP